MGKTPMPSAIGINILRGSLSAIKKQLSIFPSEANRKRAERLQQQIDQFEAAQKEAREIAERREKNKANTEAEREATEERRLLQLSALDAEEGKIVKEARQVGETLRKNKVPQDTRQFMLTVFQRRLKAVQEKRKKLI